MHSPTYSWIRVPFTETATAATPQSKHHLHRTLCLEYPAGLLSNTFKPSRPDDKHSFDAAVTGPRSLIVLITGNPGLCNFYGRFGQHLLSCANVPGLAFIVPSLAGFSLATEEHNHHKHHGGGHLSRKHNKHHQNNNQNNQPQHAQQQQVKEDGKGPFLLQDQRAFLRSFVEHFIEPILEQHQIPASRCMLLGHSIGSWFAMHLVDEFPNIFGKTVLLAPTIANMAKSRNGIKMRGLIHLGKHILPQIVGAICFLLPSRAIRGLVELTQGKELHACDIHTVNCLIAEPHVTRQLLSLASDELVTVNPLDEALLTRIQQKVIFYFCFDDEWIDNDWRDNVLPAKFPQLAGHHVEQDKSVLHNWTLRSDRVAEFVAQCFKQHCVEKPGERRDRE